MWLGGRARLVALGLAGGLAAAAGAAGPTVTTSGSMAGTSVSSGTVAPPAGVATPATGGAPATAVQGEGTGAEETSDRLIEYANDTLTVRLVAVPVEDVLAEIGRQSGAQIVGTPRESRGVSTAFENVPLTDALHRLLGDENFALVYGEGDRLKAIKLLGPPQQAPAGAMRVSAMTPPAAQMVTTTTVPNPLALGDLLMRKAPIPVSGRLAEALGTDQAQIMQLLDAGLRNDDPAVRAEAVQAGLQAIESDASIAPALDATVSGMNENDLANMVRSMGADHAEEFLLHTAARARSSELRLKAQQVLQHYREQTAGQ
jgi:hypothetical protein